MRKLTSLPEASPQLWGRKVFCFIRRSIRLTLDLPKGGKSGSVLLSKSIHQPKDISDRRSRTKIFYQAAADRKLRQSQNCRSSQSQNFIFEARTVLKSSCQMTESCSRYNWEKVFGNLNKTSDCTYLNCLSVAGIGIKYSQLGSFP